MGDMSRPGHVKILETWLKSYRPQELFDKTGRLVPELAELAPTGERRMSANPHANGGLLLRDLRLPDFRDYAVTVPQPGAVDAEATRVQGEFIRDVITRNPDNFRVFSPDETASNRWDAVFEVTNRCSTAEILPGDDHVAPDGRVMEMLSEHQCEGWLEGYLLTGRHGFFSCYEAFIHIIDSMFNQHAKWLKVGESDSVAPADRLAELPAHVARLAAGPQRLQPSGPRLHRPRREQEGRRHPRLSAARREHAALGDGPLPAQPQLRQRDRRRQAAGAAMARHGRGHQALHRRPRHLAMGQQRPGRRAGCRHGLLRRCADARNAGRGRVAAEPFPRPESPGDQRRRSDEAAAAERTSAWA